MTAETEKEEYEYIYNEIEKDIVFEKTLGCELCDGPLPDCLSECRLVS